jgi:hypothetical protein
MRVALGARRGLEGPGAPLEIVIGLDYRQRIDRNQPIAAGTFFRVGAGADAA